MGSFVTPKMKETHIPDRMQGMKSGESVSSLPCGKSEAEPLKQLILLSDLIWDLSLVIMYMTVNLNTTQMTTKMEHMNLNLTEKMTTMEITLEVMSQLLLQLYMAMNLINYNNQTRTSNSNITSNQTLTKDLNMNMNLKPGLNKMQELNMIMKPALNLIKMSSLKQRFGMDLSAMVNVINI